MKVSIYTEPRFDRTHILLYLERPEGKRFVVKPTELYFEEYSEAEGAKHTFSMNGLEAKEFLQSMVDEAAKRGIFPKGKEIIENELTAVKYHLEDMRKLVFK